MVNFGTALKDFKLPSTITITLDDNTIISSNVIWDTSTYNSTLAGNYTLTSTIANPNNITNSKNLKASLKITVLPAKNIKSVKEKEI